MRFWSHTREAFGALQYGKLDLLIFFVTSACNARCGHCFYWKNLNAPEPAFPLERVQKLSASMPAFRRLLFSGGEPFLRRDLARVVQIFRAQNGVTRVTIPTNGLLPGRSRDLATEILQTVPEVELSVNVSLDGFAETHDRLRGVPSNFERAMETLRMLLELRETQPRLAVYVNSVICSDTVHEVVPLASWLFTQVRLDGHLFEVVRGEPLDPALKSVPFDALRRVYEDVLALQARYIDRRWRRQGLGRLHRAWREMHELGALIHQYRTQLANYAHGERWWTPCRAGESAVVVDYDGGVRVCELREAAVPLATHGDDFAALTRDPRFRAEVSAAASHTCDCTHVCFLNTAQQSSWRARLLYAPWYHLRFRICGRAPLGSIAAPA
jgi:Fe-coproporphyrin III synthase